MLWYTIGCSYAAPVSDLEDLTQLLLDIQIQKVADKIQDLQDLLDDAAAQNWPTILKAIHEIGNPSITQYDNYDDDTVELQGWIAAKNLLQVISALNNAQDNDDTAGQSWINTNALKVLKAIHALNISSIIEDDTTDLQSWKVVRKNLLGIHMQFPSNNVAVQDSRKMNARNILKALHSLSTIDRDDDSPELQGWKELMKSLPHVLQFPNAQDNDIAVLEVMNPKKDPMYYHPSKLNLVKKG